MIAAHNNYAYHRDWVHVCNTNINSFFVSYPSHLSWLLLILVRFPFPKPLFPFFLPFFFPFPFIPSFNRYNGKEMWYLHSGALCHKNNKRDIYR